MTSTRLGGRNLRGRRPPRCGRRAALAAQSSRRAIAHGLTFARCRASCHGGASRASSAVDPAVRGAGEQVVQAPVREHVLPERHRPVLVHDHGRVAAYLGKPLAEFLGIAHRRRQRHDLHRLGQMDDDFLPHRAAEPVGEVVHLVEHDVAEAGQRARTGVQHVPQHLGGHHHHRRLAVDAVVAGEQADLGRPVPPDQIRVLLVGQRLDRRGVEALAACRQREVHGELADNRLARTCRGRDEHARAVLEPLASPALEVVELEVVQRLEGG